MHILINVKEFLILKLENTGERKVIVGLHQIEYSYKILKN